MRSEGWKKRENFEEEIVIFELREEEVCLTSGLTCA